MDSFAKNDLKLQQSMQLWFLEQDVLHEALCKHYCIMHVWMLLQNVSLCMFACVSLVRVWGTKAVYHQGGEKYIFIMPRRQSNEPAEFLQWAGVN